MIYDYIYDIEKTDLFLYGGGLLFITLLIRRINLSSNTIFGLICGIIVIYYINDKKIATNGGFIQKMNTILKSPLLKADKNKYLYRDSELVDFLDNYLEYHQYNPDIYNSFISHINTLLMLINDLDKGDQNYNNDYETILELRYKILNTFHSFIHKIPHTPASNDKFHIGANRLQVLLNKHIDKVHLSVVKLNGMKDIDTDTKFPYRNQPEPRDHNYEPQYHFF